MNFYYGNSRILLVIHFETERKHWITYVGKAGPPLEDRMGIGKHLCWQDVTSGHVHEHMISDLLRYAKDLVPPSLFLCQ